MDIPYHRDHDCLLVWHRITCEKCDYLQNESRFDTIEAWYEHEKSMQYMDSGDKT